MGGGPRSVPTPTGPSPMKTEGGPDRAHLPGRPIRLGWAIENPARAMDVPAPRGPGSAALPRQWAPTPYWARPTFETLY